MRKQSPVSSSPAQETLGEALSEQAFTADQASRLTGCTPHQLRYWDRVGLVKPSIQGTGGRPGVRRLYSFRDLVALRVVKGLLDNGMSLQRVRRAWDYLRRHADFNGFLLAERLETADRMAKRGKRHIVGIAQLHGFLLQASLID